MAGPPASDEHDPGRRDDGEHDDGRLPARPAVPLRRVLRAALGLELVLAALGLVGLVVEVAGTPAIDRCADSDAGSLLYLSILAGVLAVPVGAVVGVGLAATWVHRDPPVPSLRTEAVLTAGAVVLGGLSVLGWVTVCSGGGPLGT